jgi:phage-related protein
MPERLKPIPPVFWRSATGREPVREWLNELSREDKRIIGRDIAKVQYGWPIGLPLCRPLSAGLWEIRAPLPSKREARVFFGFHDGMLIALHAMLKKTQKTRRKIWRWHDRDLRSCNHGKEKPAHRLTLRELAR